MFAAKYGNRPKNRLLPRSVFTDIHDRNALPSKSTMERMELESKQLVTSLEAGDPMNKVIASAEEAVTDIASGSSLAVGGFGLCGIPSTLIAALLYVGVTNLETVSNNCGVDDWGLGTLLSARRVGRATSSYVGENREFARQFLSGELEVELVPQGTLAERLRAGGAGIPAFYTRAGVGTQVAQGGLPRRYDGAGGVAIESEPKEVRTFAGTDYVLERAITCDFALVHACLGDRHGNLVYEKSAQNFNPLCAAAGRVTIAEVEELVEPGDIDPAAVHTPGIFVQRVVVAAALEKRIERRTVARPPLSPVAPRARSAERR
jgi:3-oxoacid CoA-transferase subunit A